LIAEDTAMMLDGKIAIICGGGGSVGAVTGAAFAAQGAAVHLVGRTSPPWRRPPTV
jgi:3-oxoacyl-[acyl-carrier protein] reductase